MAKEYYIEIDGEQIWVTEEVYRAYKRPLWAEHKRKERQRKRAQENANAPGATPLSTDRMLENGLDIADPGDSLEDVVKLGIAIEELRKALSQLAPDDRAIMELFGYGLSDRKISAKIGMPQTTVSYRRKKLFKKLREQLKEYR